MKHFFSLLFALFLTLSAQAAPCPADKPLQGKDGVCYSCDEPTIVMINEIVNGKNCHKICPNRDTEGFYKTTDAPCIMNSTLGDYYRRQEQLDALIEKLSILMFCLNLFILFFIFRGILSSKISLKNKSLKILAFLICGILAFIFSIIAFKFNGLFIPILLLGFYKLVKYIKEKAVKVIPILVLYFFLFIITILALIFIVPVYFLSTILFFQNLIF